MFADETNRLGFPDSRTRQNNNIIFLFICSGLFICRNGTFIASVISKKTFWTKIAVILNLCVCILCPEPLELFNTYFSCLAFFFPKFTKFTPWFRKWHNICTNTYTAHMKLLSKNLNPNCRSIPRFWLSPSFMEWTGSCLQQTCKQT